MRSSNILAAIVGAAAIAAFIAAATTAAPRQDKSYNQCQREARSLGWNLNDESDIAQANKYITQCQRGEYGERVVSRSERALARREPQQVNQRPARRDDSGRRALAQAEPQYRQYGAPMMEFCRSLAVFRGWRLDDEEDISQAHGFMQRCMTGTIAR